MNHIESPRVDDAGLEPRLAAMAVAPRVTPADLTAAIVAHQFLQPEGTTLTICVLTLRNGFTVTGESAAASPANFDAKIGQDIAYENAKQKLWPLLGYALKERMSGEVARLVAGALYQLMGDLTTRDIPITLGAAHNAAPAADVVRDWLRANGIADAVEPRMEWTPPAVAPADFRERVRAEKRELDERLGKLEAFIDSERFQSLPDPEQGRMRRQATAMRECSTVLHERIGAFE
jgi:hypothetical protein